MNLVLKIKHNIIFERMPFHLRTPFKKCRKWQTDSENPAGRKLSPTGISKIARPNPPDNPEIL